MTSEQTQNPSTPLQTIELSAFRLDLPATVVHAVQSLPDPADWLARVITEAARRELLTTTNVEITVNTQPAIQSPSSSNPDMPPRRGHATTPEPDPIPVGSLVRNSLRWLGTVQTYNPDTGRYLIAFHNGVLREFPRYLLTFVALASEQPETLAPPD
ncbi:MAG: hypothetical protein NZ772_06100 [Cyanobacteria bacterium]|nr:hypothetical protein [Cyanobacteriota bacterium]MDW8201096.1 hypothetical protein [Cyanobacteriota bacterium SKYGB_h_bin112]